MVAGLTFAVRSFLRARTDMLRQLTGFSFADAQCFDEGDRAWAATYFSPSSCTANDMTRICELCCEQRTFDPSYCFTLGITVCGGSSDTCPGRCDLDRALCPCARSILGGVVAWEPWEWRFDPHLFAGRCFLGLARPLLLMNSGPHPPL